MGKDKFDITNDEIMSELISYSIQNMENNNAYPFCAFIVKDNEVVGKGFNSKVNDFGDKTMHGEMEAMKNACINLNQGIYLKDCTLFSTCEPCLACFDAALWSKINNFVYSVDHFDFPEYFHDHDYSIEKYIEEHPTKIKVTSKIRHQEGLSLFKLAKEKYGW